MTDQVGAAQTRSSRSGGEVRAAGGVEHDQLAVQDHVAAAQREVAAGASTSMGD